MDGAQPDARLDQTDRDSNATASIVAIHDN
jgi:hypothetical protein